MRRIGLVALALGADVGLTAAAQWLDLADVDALVPLALVVVAAALALALRWLPLEAAIAFGTAWFILGVARHLVDLAPRWRGTELDGIAHVLWDLAYHTPSLAVVAIATARSAPDGVRVPSAS